MQVDFPSTTDAKVKPLGSYLVEVGVLTQADVDIALADQTVYQLKHELLSNYLPIATQTPCDRYIPCVSLAGETMSTYSHPDKSFDRLHRDGWSVVVVHDSAALAEHVAAWEDLVAAALEPNVFYEPWMLLPAFQAFGNGKDIRFVLVFAPNPNHPLGLPLLCGFFPLERQSRYKGLPIGALSLWQHTHCYLCTPLLRTEYAHQALATFFDWLGSDPRRPPLLELKTVHGEGPFHQLLVDHLHEHTTLPFVSSCYTRAFFRPRQDGNAYVQASLKGRHRRGLKRLERLLAETGQMQYLALEAGDDIEAWIEAFLQIEASGWKGRVGTALACTKADQTFFRAVTKEAFRHDRLLMFALHHNGCPIALNCYYRGGEGCYFFKPAFDESYAAFSPGRLLEVETIRRLHAWPGIQWADSCTSPNNELMNGIWMDRRTIMTVLISTDRSLGNLLVSVHPLLKWLKQKFFGKRGGRRLSSSDAGKDG